MPKELYEIRTFNKGTVSVPSEEDIPPNAATDSKDLETLNVDGKLIGRKSSTNMTLASSATAPNIKSSALVDTNETDGKLDLIYHDGSKIGVLKDFYTTRTKSELGSLASTSPNSVVNNKEVHMGTGNTGDHPTKWVGYQKNSQFGSTSTSIISTDAECSAIDNFPVMYKVVARHGSSYLFGIQGPTEANGVIYRIDSLSLSPTITTEYGLFGELQAITTDHTYIYVVEKKNSILFLHKLDLGLKVLNSSVIQESSSNITFSISDIHCTSTKIWYKKKFASYNASLSNTDWLYNSPYPTGSTIAITDTPLPYQNKPSSDLEISNITTGDNTDLNLHITGMFTNLGAKLNSPKADFANAPMAEIKYKTYDICFVQTETLKSYMHIDVEMRASIDSWSNDVDAYMFHHAVFDGSNIDAYSVRLSSTTKRCFWVVNEAWSGSYLNDDGNNGASNNLAVPVTYTVGSNTEEPESLGTFLQTYVGKNGTTKSHVKLQAVTDHNAIYSNTNTDESSLATNHLIFKTTYTNTGISKSSGVVWKDVSDAYGDKYFVFNGNGGGIQAKWNVAESGGTAGDLSSYAIQTVSPLGISITDNVGSDLTTGPFALANRHWYYKVNFVYDGYQHSPLSDSTAVSETKKYKNISVELNDPVNVPKRITAVNLWRAERDTVNFTTSQYRLIKELSLDASWELEAVTSLPSKRTTSFIDYGDTAGATYDGVTGISEVIKNTMVNRSLSCSLNNVLFAGDCYHPLLQDVRNYIFKSLPYKYDMFDWTKDFLVLPEIPIAMVPFNGRIFAFSKNNMYRIDPNTFYIEDTYESIGCASSKSIVVTEQGMCFADATNVYLYDGSKVIPLANAILTGNSKGYQDLFTEADPPVVTYDPTRNSFLICMQGSSSRMIWAYSLNQRRWDRWSYDIEADINSGIIGKDALYLSYADSTPLLSKFGTNSTRKAFTWTSKDIIVGQSTQDKKFYETNKVGDATVTVKDTAGSTISSFPYKGRAVRLFVEGTASQSLDSVGIVFRSYLKLFDNVSSS